jgi:hypothetical protein
LTAYSFSQKFKSKVVLDLVGCDYSKSYSTSWHLSKLVLDSNFSGMCNIQRRLTKLERISAKITFNLPSYQIINSELETVNIYDRGLTGSKYFFPHFENRYFLNTPYYIKFIREVRNYIFNHLNYSNLKTESLITPKSSGSVAIHLRLSDDGQTIIDRAAKTDWIISALQKAHEEEKVLNHEVVCFTDTPGKAEFLRKYVPKLKVVGQEIPPLEALLTLSKFQNLILVNSSFSFWAGEFSDANLIISPCGEGHQFEPTKQYLHMPATEN